MPEEVSIVMLSCMFFFLRMKENEPTLPFFAMTFQSDVFLYPSTIWHLGPEDSLLWKTVLCIVGCSVIYRVPARQIPVVPFPQLGLSQTLSRHCPVSAGQNHTQLRTIKEALLGHRGSPTSTVTAAGKELTLVFFMCQALGQGVRCSLIHMVRHPYP